LVVAHSTIFNQILVRDDLTKFDHSRLGRIWSGPTQPNLTKLLTLAKFRLRLTCPNSFEFQVGSTWSKSNEFRSGSTRSIRPNFDREWLDQIWPNFDRDRLYRIRPNFNHGRIWSNLDRGRIWSNWIVALPSPSQPLVRANPSQPLVRLSHLDLRLMCYYMFQQQSSFKFINKTTILNLSIPTFGLCAYVLLCVLSTK